MAMRVETVDILVEKARFEPQVAVAVAQAMDTAMEESMRDRQLVTVPVLEARHAVLESRMLRHMYSAMRPDGAALWASPTSSPCT